MKRVIFKDELCDAKWKEIDSNTIEIACQKGTIKITGDAVTQFQAYHGWCKGCDKKHVVDRTELKEAFDSIARNIEKEFEK